MKRFNYVKVFSLIIAVCLIASGLSPVAHAQPKPSFSVAYDTYPYSKLTNPSTDPVNGQRNFEQDLEIRVATLYIDASYPIIFSEGKTVLVNQLAFQRFDLDYDKWDEVQGGTNRIEHTFSIEYSLTLVRQLQRRWSLMAILTPGAASDFRDDLDKNDFTIQAVVVFIKQFSEAFSMGYGLAYSTTFGQAFPFPIIALNWNNGSNLKLESILPVSVELSYLPTENLTTGLLVGLDGNQFHGAESDYTDVKNPQLRYSVATVGPTLKYRLTQGLQLSISGGLTFFRRFEFYDGNDKGRSLDLQGSGFIKAGLQIGG